MVENFRLLVCCCGLGRLDWAVSCEQSQVKIITSRAVCSTDMQGQSSLIKVVFVPRVSINRAISQAARYV